MSAPRQSRFRPRGLVLAAGVVVVGVLVAGTMAVHRMRPSPSSQAPPVPPLAQARQALRQQDWDRAEKLAAQVDREHSGFVRSRLVAGEAAMKAGRYETAADYFAAVPRDGSSTSVLAALSLAEVCREVGRLTEAEEAYQYVLQYQPDNTAAHSRLAFLYGVSGRREKCRPHFMYLVRRGSWAPEALVLLSDLGRPWEHNKYLQRCLKQHPEDVLVRLGVAALDFAEGRPAEARSRLPRIVAEAPHLIAAQAMLGELLVDGDDGPFLAWHEALPAEADASPEIWHVRGLWVRRHGQLKEAARCFWEALRREPTHRRATYQLSQVLVALHDEAGPVFSRRSRQWYDLTEALDGVLRSEGEDEASARKVVEILEQTGRLWEAWAWAKESRQTYPGADWPGRVERRVRPLLSAELPRLLDEENLMLRHDYSHWPDHTALVRQVRSEIGELAGEPGAFASGSESESGGRVRSGADGPAGTGIRFVDEAERAGIEFVYFNSPDPLTEGARMFESDGGGAGVLDYDRDGWPDLYFTQGAPWKHGESASTPSPRYRDPLYRNLAGEFLEATSQAGLGSMGFGQGCSVGDFDQDGFADLYVANVGFNRLYRNNGDGTFTDVTGECGLVADDWTSSCLMADLNGDGFPDLYDVTYLQGELLHQFICDGEACSPQIYDGSPNRAYVSGGDGTFAFLPHPDQGASAKESKGLGLVAANVYGDGRLNLFITNDQSPNFYLRSEPAPDASGMRLVNDAFAAGLAFEGEGLSLACMGIAADDVNGDGRIDFFVTNFRKESNTLYSQDLDGLFVDVTNAAGLEAPSLPFVGWGAQFLDADLDGWPDLVVVNGDVDDYRSQGGKYHMRPQFYYNTGGGRFVELFGEQVGDWFDEEYLGRGLARLDWNRDGRPDFVVSQIADRAALMTNVSTDVGHFLNVRLHATLTARDAIGTIVEVTAGERQWRKQLTAGDGFQASNERVVPFGLGAAGAVDQVRVQWPSGAETILRSLPVDVTVELIEQAPRAAVWHDSQTSELIRVE